MLDMYKERSRVPIMILNNDVTFLLLEAKYGETPIEMWI